jgi:hypothetical protein
MGVASNPTAAEHAAAARIAGILVPMAIRFRVIADSFGFGVGTGRPECANPKTKSADRSADTGISLVIRLQKSTTAATSSRSLTWGHDNY